MKAMPVIRVIAILERASWRIALALVIVLALPIVASAKTAHVQYLSSSSVYLDVGRAAGIVEGTTVRVEREGRVVAELLVEFVAESSAACKILSSTSPIQSGDTCSFTPAADAPGATGGTAGGAATAAAPRPTSSQPPLSPSWLALGAVRGSLSFDYRRSALVDGSYANPAMRANLRWNGPNRRELSMRMRADRPSVSLDGVSSGSSTSAQGVRFYEAELRYRAPGQRYELSGGRFVPQGLELLGYVDGAAASLQPLHGLRFGVAGGGGAQLAGRGFETQGWKLGGFIEASDPRRDGPTRWRMLVGAARVEDPQMTRRQVVLVRGDERLGPRLRAWENVEVDYNPGWKVQHGENKVELTGLSVGAQARLLRNVDFMLGYDSRRDLLLPEQAAVPLDNLTLDRTHGVHTSVHLRMTPWTSLRLGADLRSLEDGSRTTHSWDASLYGSHPSLRQLSAVLHANVYDTSPGRGELLDASLVLRPRSHPLHVDLAGGTNRRQGQSGLFPVPDSRSNWLRFGGGLEPRWGLWIDGSAEWRTAPASTELQLQVGRRF
jgi:hypothetical protein